MYKIFDESIDETGAEWYRKKTEELPGCASQCLPQVEKYGHFIIGRNEKRWFIGIPGRFMKAEKPVQDIFTLWQPIRGGEALYDKLENIPENLQENIYGYWICGLCPKWRRLQPI
ncbi:MAG: hypothetical protein PUB87_04005 [Eubacteriaceae bacterium]|nr:hypothetical protein [Eubacteriaceae bacterium]